MRNSTNAFENNQNYTIVNHSGFVEAAGQFIYKGFKISFSTMGYNGGCCSTKVAVFDNNGNDVFDKNGNFQDFDTVEDAIEFLNSK